MLGKETMVKELQNTFPAYDRKIRTMTAENFIYEPNKDENTEKVQVKYQDHTFDMIAKPLEYAPHIVILTVYKDGFIYKKAERVNSLV